MESASSGAHAPAQRKPQLLQGLGLLNLVTAIAVCLAYLIWQSYTSLQLELGTWGCRMSWMSPNYIKMDGPRAEGMGGLENKYSLWLYREGGLQGHIKVSREFV
jgi:glycosylphosphatidylinositol deacylase